MEHVEHPFEPVYDDRSRVLILGTMASVASRKAGFYYMHPQNRFFPALAAAFGEPAPTGAAGRRAFALAHGIALWDVIASCEITGSSDSSIKNPVPNDIKSLLERTGIRHVFTTGRKAESLYNRLVLPDTGVPCTALPSPSPANCALPFDALAARYQEALLPLL